MNADHLILKRFEQLEDKIHDVEPWADRRNDAAHGNWEEYNHADVADMVKGVERFIAEYL